MLCSTVYCDCVYKVQRWYLAWNTHYRGTCPLTALGIGFSLRFVRDWDRRSVLPAARALCFIKSIEWPCTCNSTQIRQWHCISKWAKCKVTASRNFTPFYLSTWNNYFPFILAGCDHQRLRMAKIQKRFWSVVWGAQNIHLWSEPSESFGTVV